MLFCLPPITKSPGKINADWRSSQAPSSAFPAPSDRHPKWMNNLTYCPVLLIVATLRKVESDLLVFATALPTMIPLVSLGSPAGRAYPHVLMLFILMQLGSLWLSPVEKEKSQLQYVSGLSWLYLTGQLKNDRKQNTIEGMTYSKEPQIGFQLIH